MFTVSEEPGPGVGTCLFFGLSVRSGASSARVETTFFYFPALILFLIVFVFFYIWTDRDLMALCSNVSPTLTFKANIFPT